MILWVPIILNINEISMGHFASWINGGKRCLYAAPDTITNRSIRADPESLSRRAVNNAIPPPSECPTIVTFRRFLVAIN